MGSISADLDTRIRLVAFEWLSKQTSLYEDVLPRDILAQGFEFEGTQIPLVSPQGIFKPKIIPEIPLSITTTPESPYEDSFSRDNLLLYRYRGTDPKHRDNEGLRMAMMKGTPLVYFHGVVPGKYLAVWPVYIVGDLPEKLTFKVAADDASYLDRLARITQEVGYIEDNPDSRRSYITATVRQRLHQRTFRERVLKAYKEQCACCRLRHRELLDTAHIIADRDPQGLPIVKNGIALCKLHHAAFDKHFLGINPDYIIKVRDDIMEEEDGPMLLHGLKNLNDRKIILPTPRKLSPDPSLLEMRFADFKAAR